MSVPDYLGAGDIIVPNYLTQNPDGSIGADFTGHVHAKGFDLDAVAVVPIAPNAPGPAPNRLDWLKPSNGALVADIWAGADVGSPGHPTQRSYLDLDVYDINGLTDMMARLSLNHTPWLAIPRSVIASILNTAGAAYINKTILDSDGDSDYAFRPAAVRMASTGNTGALGGAFQDLPGLTTGNIALRAGQTVLLFASVQLQWGAGNVTAFWVTTGASGAVNLNGFPGTISAAGTVNVPVLCFFTATAAGNHVFKIQCQAGGGAGTGIGAAGVSHAMVVSF